MSLIVVSTRFFFPHAVPWSEIAGVFYPTLSFPLYALSNVVCYILDAPQHVRDYNS